MKTTAFTVIFGIVVGIATFSLFERGVGTYQAPGSLALSGVVGDARAFILPATQITYLPIRDFNIPDPVVNARAAVLVDGISNRTLFSKNAGQRLPIASITKLMTAIVVLESMDVDDIYTVSAEDLNVDGLGADFAQGEKLRGAELMKIMILKSSNDAASVFAAHAYKNGIDFVALMNKKAAELGMTDTHFADPAGLNDANTYSSALDIVKLVRAAMNYEYLKDLGATTQIDVPTIGGTVYRALNTNRLLRIIPKIILGKTGNTNGALGTMALAVNLDNGNYLISVVLGSYDRFGETKALFEWGKKAHQWQ